MEEQSERTVDFHFQHATDFKTTFATGSYVSLSPNALVNITFYTDRFPLPDLVTHSIENNQLGPERMSSMRQGVIRDLQQGILLDIGSVRGLITGLQQMVENYEDNVRAANKQ